MRLRSMEALAGRHQLHPIAAIGADHGVGDAGVAAGGIEEDVRAWFSLPERSPSSTMLSAARSLTEPPGLKYSALAKISTPGNSRRDPVQAQQRRVADGGGRAGADFDPARIAANTGRRRGGISVLTDESFFQGSLADLEPCARPSICRCCARISRLQTRTLWRRRPTARTHPADRGHPERARAARFPRAAARYTDGGAGRGAQPARAGRGDRRGQRNHRRQQSRSQHLRGDARYLARWRSTCPRRGAVSESGIHSAADIAGCAPPGYTAFLVGEHLMKSGDPAAALRATGGGMILKICGITNQEDASAAIEGGATAVGFNFYPRSPRYIAPEQAARSRLPAGVRRVGVFVNEARACGEIARAAGSTWRNCTARDLGRLSGIAPRVEGDPRGADLRFACRLNFAARPVPPKRCCSMDRRANCTAARAKTLGALRAAAQGRSSGRRPGRFERCAGHRLVHPWGVDACSRIESAPGKKDREK
jgi:hypothetical protein